MRRPASVAMLLGCLLMFGCDRIQNKVANDNTSSIGRFAIHNVEFKGKWTLLLDTNNGQTWILGTDNNGFLLWAEIGKENYVNVDKVATKDPMTGKIDIKPAGKKFRIDTKGNIYDVKDVRTKEDPFGIR